MPEKTLKKLRYSEARISYLEIEKERVRTLASSTALRNSDKVQTSLRTDSLDQMLIKLESLEEQIIKEIDKLVDLKIKAKKAIECLEDERYKLVLEYRYINCFYWEEIAFKLGYEKRYLLKLHREAINEFSSIYKKRH